MKNRNFEEKKEILNKNRILEEKQNIRYIGWTHINYKKKR